MKQALNKLKRFGKQVLGLIPERLPGGMNEFNAWADSIFDIYTLPTTSRTDVRWVLATEIIRLGPSTIYRSKFYFVRRLVAGAAKQIAGAAMQQIKQEQHDEQARQAAAVTVPTTAADNGQPNQA